MLQITDLTMVHTRDLRTLVEGLSFALNSGDKAAIIGEEGNGKSTLLQWIYDPALVEGYCQCSGHVTAHGHRLGYLAQELTAEERAMTVYAYCCRSAAFGELDWRELGDIAWRLGLSPELYYSQQPVGTLSGGERIKLQLSRLLFDRADVLLLDEPSSDLDLPTLGWLEDFIRDFPGIVLFISHDEVLLERTANVVLHMEYLGKSAREHTGKLDRCTVSRLDYRTYAARREAALADQTRQARKEREEYEQKMETFRQIRQRVEHEQNVISRQDPGGGRLLKKKMHTVLAMGRRFQREAQDMTQLPRVEEAVYLRFSPDTALPAGRTVLDLTLPQLWAGERLLAEDLRLHVSGGEKIGILGRNGAGKTTLLRHIAGMLLSSRDLRAAYMPQDYAEALPMDRTPLEYLAPGGRREDILRAETFLGSVRFAREEMLHPIAALSGGQKAKLFLTRMMLDDANVLVLDEPTRNFSPLSGPRVRQVLAGYGGSIISVSHDRRFLMEVCDKLYRFTENGLVPVDRETLL